MAAVGMVGEGWARRLESGRARCWQRCAGGRGRVSACAVRSHTRGVHMRIQRGAHPPRTAQRTARAPTHPTPHPAPVPAVTAGALSLAWRLGGTRGGPLPANLPSAARPAPAPRPPPT
eukprot:3295066-Prymnesium_polylepis.1